MTKFRDLPIGSPFDWINDARPDLNSFYKRCVKISARQYRSEGGAKHTVGTINAEVFHAVPHAGPQILTDMLNGKF